MEKLLKMDAFLVDPNVFLISDTVLVYFSVNLCSHYFCDCRKERPYKHESDNKCLSVGNFGILSVVVVCSASTAYTSLCRGLKYLLKIIYIILVYPNVARFLNFLDSLLRQSKEISQKLTAFEFGST